ncbi:SgcJ/EcaC family oxidoreductase [Spiractinospora alimapuensis]|uniref:SgcJ/EcaC family oxidoreductase n=1 Tax=Spiractinospora alimapuensis TaxID=2820884 RepID=UPI001F2F6EA2|nr:SgcJ/EcaC family oxidoreductase [Spiractinospora alimapuensis]QVQ50259.1 SgcJ/EcaC family oxidoreductase [Spiractinospora alimapuensis]
MAYTTGGRIPSEADLAAIETLVGQLQSAQQRARAEEFLDLFAGEAIWTTAHGKLLPTRDAIETFTRTVLPPSVDAPVTATFDIEHIQFLRDDVAAVKIRQRPITRGGDRLDDELVAAGDLEAGVRENPDRLPGTPMHVLVKDGGRWLIAAAQNTKVVDPEEVVARFTG